MTSGNLNNMQLTSFDTTQAEFYTPMEYKYVAVMYNSGQRTVVIHDLNQAGNPTTSFGLLMDAGWKPVRESQLGGGGESAGMAVLILMERPKVDRPKLKKRRKMNATDK